VRVHDDTMIMRTQADRDGLLPFPGLWPIPADVLGDAEIFDHPKRRQWFLREHALQSYDLVFLLCWSFEAEWPIRPDVPACLKGFRRSVGLSQVRFAERLGVARVSVERWEAGGAKPFRGNVLALLAALRPLVHDPVSAGQLLNLAAAAVCPRMTRPTARYTMAEIGSFLRDGRHDHTVLAAPLVHMLVEAAILAPFDPEENGGDVPYVPLVGLDALAREPVHPELLAVARRLSSADLRLWLTLGRRLAAGDTTALDPAGDRA
jgi:transcriptional regulator with XRE-family HTH domain